MNGGTLIRVVPKTLFDFAYLPAGATDSIVVAKAINVIPYSAAYLWVRVYQLRIGSGGAVNVTATPALPADDTQQSFLGTAIAMALTGTAPLLLNASLTSSNPLPPYFQIAVQGQQNSGTATNVGVEISIDLLVRCCG